MEAERFSEDELAQCLLISVSGFECVKSDQLLGTGDELEVREDLMALQSDDTKGVFVNRGAFQREPLSAGNRCAMDDVARTVVSSAFGVNKCVVGTVISEFLFHLSAIACE